MFYLLFSNFMIKVMINEKLNKLKWILFIIYNFILPEFINS